MREAFSIGILLAVGYLGGAASWTLMPTAAQPSRKCTSAQLRQQKWSTTSFPLVGAPLMASPQGGEGESEAVEEEKSTTTWSPTLRKIMGTVSGAGALETAYLTYQKVFGNGDIGLCGTASGSCSDVLTGAYSNVPFTNDQIPLSLVGFVAYASMVWLSLSPLADAEKPVDDSVNRVLLTAISTAMATFSIFLMVLLFSVLHQNCPFCIFSATCSLLLANLAWIGGCLPEAAENNKMAKIGSQVAATSFLGSTLAAVVLFVASPSSSSLSFDSSSLIASTASGAATTKLYSPPPITTTSSQRALQLSNDMESLQAKMYGAYWCSHCYDQKESLGKEFFQRIPYVECSKEGQNSQSKLCKAKEVPGYPTWEVSGQLFPGEQSIEELEEIVSKAKSGAS